jgi:enediyne biosynthesis protein E4
MLLARNTGHGFVDVSQQSGNLFRQAWVSRGMAIGDLDNDGRLDAVVTTNDGWVHVLHNETVKGNHWILLKLVGRKSNRDAIGAEVTLVAGAGPQYATVSTTGSYLSASDKRVHFGMGQERVAQKIEILWPSGIKQTLKDIPGDQILQIDEPDTPSTPPKP